MKLLTFVFATMLAGGCAASNPPPAHVADPAPLRVKQSIVRVTGESHGGQRYFTCTGFAIDTRKYMTAAHCVPESIYGMPYVLKADGVVATAIKVDTKTDLAVLLVDMVKPSLSFRDSPVTWLETVMAMGFGHGFTVPITTTHTLQSRKYNLGVDTIHPGNVYEHPFIGGMSGGPIFDNDGMVVGVVQLSSEYIAYGVDVETIMNFLLE